MKKAEAEQVIRYLCGVWAQETGIPKPAIDQPSYRAFKTWACAKGYGRYFDFRSVGGPDYTAERWFDEEFGQTWRN